jgi:hypothetical protein
VALVAKAAPDGHTIGLATTGELAVNTHIKAMPFDPLKERAPITLFGKLAFIFAAWPQGPAKSIADVVRVGKAARPMHTPRRSATVTSAPRVDSSVAGPSPTAPPPTTGAWLGIFRVAIIRLAIARSSRNLLCTS